MKSRRVINSVSIALAMTASLLLTSALSWAEVKLIVVRDTTTNKLTATVCDSSQANPCTPVSIPTNANASSLLPALGWDQFISPSGGWTIVGMNSAMVSWYGEIARNAGSTVSYSLTLLSGTPDPVVTPTAPQSPTYEPPFQQVVYAAPEPCQSYTYVCTGACASNGSCPAVVTGSYPVSCSGGVSPTANASCTYIPPACTAANVTAWTPATCPSSGQQTASIYQSTCTPPATPMTKSCTYVPPACTAADVTAWTPATCPSSGQQTASTYASTCSPPATALTRACTVGAPTCTAANVTAWTPATCPSSGQQTASTYQSTCTPPATPLMQSCTYIPPGSTSTVTLSYNVYHEKTLLPGATQFYQFTQSSACTTALKQLRVLMIEMSLAGGDGSLLVKSSNQGRATPVTLADYTYEFGKAGFNNPGQDWTRDAANGGVFFYGFLNGNGGETVGVNSVFSGHTFNQADTYYVLVTNRGDTSNTYRTSFRCY